MLPSQAAEVASSTGTGGSDSPPIVLTPTSSLDSNDNVVPNTTDASREAVANETNTNYHHYQAATAEGPCHPYIMPPGPYCTTYPDFAGGNLLNWQSYQNLVLPQEYEPGVGTCSNFTCEGINQAGIGIRDMEFRNEQERRWYLDGWGLPKGGNSAEERLLRAINMNHYILVGHIDKTSRDMRAEQREMEQQQQKTWEKLHMLERKIQKPGPRNSGQPYLTPPSHSPQDTTIENGYSIKRLDLAITQLWAHVDKLKTANELLLEEKVERKELEEILATELLYHNHTMERMQTKISSLTKEVTCCWTEIRNLQDAVKGLGSGAIGKKLQLAGEKIRPTGTKGNSTPATLSCRMVNTQKMLEKINEELERLNDDRSHTLCVDPTHATHCDSTRQKSPLTAENEDECDCDLCGKAREWKSAGIGKRDEGVVGKVSSPQESGSVDAKGSQEKPNAHDRISSGTCHFSSISVAWYLEFLNLTLIDYTLITNVTPNSHALQMWCSAYESMRLEGQKVIAMELFNGDVILCLTVPNKDGKVIDTHIKELKEGLATAAVKSILDLESRKLKSKESIASNCVGTDKVSSYPTNRAGQGPQLETVFFQLPTSTAASNSATASAGEPTNASPSTVVPTIGFSGKPTKQTNTQPFAPLPEIARTAIPGHNIKEKPKFGTYGFPWLEQGQVGIDWRTSEDKDKKEWDWGQKLELGVKACERCADGTAESAVDLLSRVDAALASMRARKHQYDKGRELVIPQPWPKKVEVEDVRDGSDVGDKDMAKGKGRGD